MNRATRKTVIAGNWKMNMTPSQTTALINEMKTTLPAEPACDVVLCVPFVDIAAAKAAAEGSVIKIGAENVHFAPKGAYTGERKDVLLGAAKPSNLAAIKSVVASVDKENAFVIVCDAREVFGEGFGTHSEDPM